MPGIDHPIGQSPTRSARVCGRRWTDATQCTSGGEHVCWRTSPEHRSHICTCEAVELQSTGVVITGH
jgi:hypothetical protein